MPHDSNMNTPRSKKLQTPSSKLQKSSKSQLLQGPGRGRAQFGLWILGFLAVGCLLLCDSYVIAGGAAEHGMVASVNPIATEAGLKVLRQGGNAVDAAVSVALTLGVVDTDN